MSQPNLVLRLRGGGSVGALESHWETDHMKIFLGQLPAILDGEVATRRYEVRSGDDDPETSEYDQDSPSYDSMQGKIVH